MNVFPIRFLLFSVNFALLTPVSAYAIMTLLPKPADMIDTPTTACARYGTGDFLTLHSRIGITGIVPTSYEAFILKVPWSIVLLHGCFS